MIIGLQHDHAAFRAALRQWIPDTMSRYDGNLVAQNDEEEIALERWWMSQLAEEGLAIPHWPSEYGGADLNLAGQVIIADEMARAQAPATSLFVVSLNHIPGTLIPFGTEAQKRKYLPEIPKGVLWCQGFSEPGAGSDLASLRTRAVRDGDHYVVNGQKIWSSGSMFAQRCILLVRTDPDARKHAGITFLLMDMDTPGVEVRPIRQITGSAEFAEMFLTDVRIPVENRVGEENRGWQVSQATLSTERGVLWFDHCERRRGMIEEFYKRSLEGRAEWLDDMGLRREFMALLTDIQAGRRHILQMIREHHGGYSGGGPAAAAMVKLLDTTIHQRFGNLLARIEGLSGQNVKAGWGGAVSGMGEYLWSYAGTISGGTNEIMRNIIAERGLGLPKG